MSRLGEIGEMYGDHAIMAPAAIVATRTGTVDGIERTMIGGVVLDGFGTQQWERWRGTMIFIPRLIDATRKQYGGQLQHLMLDGLNRDGSVEAMKDRDSFWKSKWRAK